MIKTGLLGATGYAGMELVRLLSAHPDVEIRHLASHSMEGAAFSSVYPSFPPSFGQVLEKVDLEKVAGDCDVVFTSLPHSASMDTVKSLYGMGARVIDLSGDYRYDDAAVYEKWYGAAHKYPELLKESVYGLTELHRARIKTARIVGNPGCYTTCAILALAPLMGKPFIDPHSIIVDAKSGTTGAGRTPSEALHFSEVDENVKAYNVGVHRHTSEIEQELSLLQGHEVVLSFTPHLLPSKRGILSTIYCSLEHAVTHEEVETVYKEFFADEPFVVLHPKGSLPQVKYVNGSNCIHIGFVVDPRTMRLVIVSALDNLIKGAAGQAVQNMNLMFDIPESSGLSMTGWYL